jgi:MoxR-like ATPase
MMHVKIDYPSAESEKEILKLNRTESNETVKSKSDDPLILAEEIFSIRSEILNLHMDETIEEYLIQLIMATRFPQKYSDKLKSWLDYGASPRGTINLDRCARAHAWLADRDYVTPIDIQSVVHEVLRHRIGLSFEAESNGVFQDQVVDEILNLVSLP